MEEELNYKVLRKIQQLEKNSPELSKIPQDFYEKVQDLLEKMKEAERIEENSQKKMLLHDEHSQTKKITLSIFEHREKKLVLAALSSIRSGKPNLSNLCSQELAIYETLVSTIQQGRSLIWERKKQERTTELKQKPVQPVDTLQIKKPADTPVKPLSVKNTNTILLITEDIPTFMGTDTQEYSLKKHDIISLPLETAGPLMKRNVAVKI